MKPKHQTFFCNPNYKKENPGRPRISFFISATANVSEYVDLHLTPPRQKAKTICSVDTTDVKFLLELHLKDQNSTEVKRLMFQNMKS